MIFRSDERRTTLDPHANIEPFYTLKVKITSKKRKQKREKV